MAIETRRNQLYPVFLKMDQLRILIVGAGEVALEKLTFLYKSSPNARVKIIAPNMIAGVKSLLEGLGEQVIYERREFRKEDVADADVIIAATNLFEVNVQVHAAAKSFGKIVNVADTPHLCDFYMGAIVTKGNLKVAISTNGKSPTFAKRFRQYLEEILPDETDELLDNLREIRNGMKSNFAQKVKELNRITESLIAPYD